jgi:hypothetical protein
MTYIPPGDRPPGAELDGARRVQYGRPVRRRAAVLVVVGCGLAGGGAAAIAQNGGGGGSERPLIRIPGGCIDQTKQVTVRIRPRANTMLSPVNISSGRRVAVHLTGVTQEASVTVRVAAGPLHVSGETIGGDRFSAVHNFHRCTPLRTPRPSAPSAPAAPVTGGGEG